MDHVPGSIWWVPSEQDRAEEDRADPPTEASESGGREPEDPPSELSSAAIAAAEEFLSDVEEAIARFTVRMHP